MYERQISYSELRPNELRLVKLHAGSFSSPIEISRFNAPFKPTLKREADAIPLGDPGVHKTSSPTLGDSINPPGSTDGATESVTPGVEGAFSGREARFPGRQKRNYTEAFTDQSSPYQDPPYEALSYIWGAFDDSTKYTINIRDGNEILEYHVRPSLFEALRQLRYAKTDRMLYIDLLSINQYDSKEKSEQIALFPDIFHHASGVCIWLGPSKDSSDLAIDFTDQILDFRHFDEVSEDPKYRTYWLALSKFIARDWFQRRWIVQEMALARKAKIYCGSKSCSWAKFTAALGLAQTRWTRISQILSIDKAAEVGEVQPPGATNLVRISTNIFRRDRDGWVTERRYDLETLLAILPIFRVTALHDAVYSVMALARDVEVMRTIPIDYNMDPAVLFASTVDYIVRASGSLDIICRPWAPNPLGEHFGRFCHYETPLPSWVGCDSNYPFVRRPDGQYDRENGDTLVGLPDRRRYNAAANLGSAQCNISYQPKLTLVVNGFKIDSIQRDGGSSYYATIPEKWQIISGWKRRASEPVPEAFWRTLVADRTADGDNPPTWFGEACEYAFRLVNTKHISVAQLNAMCKGSSHVQEFLHRVQAVICNRSLFLSDRLGALGLGPSSFEVGNWICALQGCSVPVILRPRDENSFELIGECFMNGVMDGEAVEQLKRDDGKYNLTELILV